MDLMGKDKTGKNKAIRFELIARSGDDPFIPCMPAILLAKKLANGEIKNKGATPCIGIISKKEYLDALEALDISWTESELEKGSRSDEK